MHLQSTCLFITFRKSFSSFLCFDWLCVLDVHEITSVENPAASSATNDTSRNTPVKDVPVAEEYYDDWDNLSEPPDAGEIAKDTDSSDYEDCYTRRNRKKKEKARKAKVR